MATVSPPPSGRPRTAPTFRGAVLRGMGVVLPPLLTIVIFVWVGNTVQDYVLSPVTAGVREVLVRLQADIREDLRVTDPVQHTAMTDRGPFYRLDSGQFVPLAVYDVVRRYQGNEPLPANGTAVYRRYVELTYLRPYYTIPFFLSLFILLLYLLGNFIAAGIGNYFWNRFEQGIGRLPLVRNVYAAVKQVSDFFFREQEFQFTRVVAVEYPRHGMWIMAFVTSEGFVDIREAAKEPVLGVFVPTSPMPMAGYALIVLKREVVDLTLTIDQAIQFIVSCGVVIPPQELQEMQRSQSLGKSSMAEAVGGRR